MWVITNAFDEDELYLWNYKLQARTILDWENHPNAVHLRFEDLVGERGGGSNEKQSESIEVFCNALGVPITEEELGYLTENLWGVEKKRISTTFRKGEIGSWKKYFKPMHIKSFKRRLGEELILLCYEDGYDW